VHFYPNLERQKHPLLRIGKGTSDLEEGSVQSDIQGMQFIWCPRFSGLLPSDNNNVKQFLMLFE